MLLASIDVLRPVAGMGPLVVEESTNTQLFGGGSVPAGPVPGAGSLVAENAVQPVAVLGLDGRVHLSLAVAVISAPRVIAALRDPAMFPREDQAVGTVEELCLPIHALPVTVAVL